MNKLVSIIIPIYNAEKYLPQCFESIINQTYQNLEVLLINDGSIDKSEEVCKNYCKKDSRFVYFKKENGGVSSARNIGLDKAKGEFVIFIDADDWIENHYVSTLYYNLVDNNAELSICGFFQHKRNSKYNQQKKIYFQKFNNTECMSQMLSGKIFNGSLWNKMFIKSNIGELKFDEKIFYGEDLYFCFQYLQKIKKTVYSNIKLYHYILSQHSIVRSKFNKKKLSLITALEKIINCCEENQYEAASYAKGWFAMINLELLYYVIRDKYCDKKLKKLLKINIKNNLIYLKQNKLFPTYRRKLVPIAYKILRLF